MDVSETIASAIKKPRKKGVKSKKKRLTFQDEVHAEEKLLLKDSTHLVTARSTSYLTFGFVFIKSLPYQSLDIVGATYNNRSKKLVLIDGRGFFSLDLIPSNCTVKREMKFQKYQFNLARIITYSDKFNVYFVLQKDFAIKVYNKDYAEICCIENPDLGRLTFISFNPVKDELISGGITGVKTWKFKEKKGPLETNPIPMYNYGLFLSTEYPHMGKNWCTNMDFDVLMQRYYCFSDGHFFCYDINGKLLLEIPNAHQSSILSCVYSSDVNILLTSSKDSEIKSWNDQGCLLHIFQGHSKTVTKLLLHPNTTSLFISGSLDGSVRLWSFDTMDAFYSLSLFQEGVLWIGTMEDKFLYCCSAHNVHIYDLNSFTSFWTHINSPISHLHICSAVGKSSRVVAMGVDNSLRIISVQNGTKLCTVLPPPYPTLLQPVLSFTYNRTSGTIYFLLTPCDIWVYTARTDPACRVAVWTTRQLQEHLHRKHPLASCIEKNEYFQHTQKNNFRTSVRCECLCSLSSSLCYLVDEGMVYADNQEFLVLGMQDGRILFLHTSIQNLVYYEMATYKDPVIHLQHDTAYRQLVIMCQKPKYKLIHFRSLPSLELVFQVYIPNDGIVFTRLDRSLFIGLKSGTVDILNILEEDSEMTFPEKEKMEEDDPSANYHDGPVIAVDSCKNLSIFLSCGSDAIIKLWNINKILVAEITLDNTLSTACFLNSSGDILLAFKNDIYILHHNKISLILKTTIQTAKVSETESYIFESQLLDEQDKIDVSKSVEMASYLVPYKGYDFTEDFTSELQVLPKKKGKRFWKLPLAPSKIYLSPCTSEASLKVFDFLLQAGTHNLEEQDKAKMSERMIVTKDMKYVPGPKPAAPTVLEIPFFGVSPCPSFVQEPPKTTKQQEEQTVEKVCVLSPVEPLKETLSEAQKQETAFCEETSQIPSEIMPKHVYGLHKQTILETNLQRYSYIYEGKLGKYSEKDRVFRRVKHPMETISSGETATYSGLTEIQKKMKKQMLKKHKPRKLLKTAKMGVMKKWLPKHTKPFSATTGAVRSRNITCTIQARSARSATSVGQKVFPALGTQELTTTEKRPFSRKKTEQQYNEGYKSPYENHTRVVIWRRKENERIQQVEEQRLSQELKKRPCSHTRCFTPNSSQQYQKLEYSDIVPESLFTWMKPCKQYHGRPYTVMEETTINLPRDFPYRLAWGTPITQDLNIKLYHPKLKFRKEQRISRLLEEKILQPTRSIPDKGRYILVNDSNPAPSAPVMSSLESRLLSARFPGQKEKILRSLL